MESPSSRPSMATSALSPGTVVRTPEEAAARKDSAYDYVILCIKALPDIYDLASVIDSVVTPQHTCIIVNTTQALGLESAIEERFPTNVVLSLVCGAEIAQLGASEFEHKRSTELWVGAANKNANIPASIQEDMAQALAMTLSTGQVDCKVSPNIRQQQFERVIGPIAFNPLTVLFETPNYAALLDKVGVSKLVSDVIDELLALATAYGCKFPAEFKKNTIDEFARLNTENIMWQDYNARRPMEVETYLGSPIKLAKDVGVTVPRIETLYAILHNLNLVNRSRPKADVTEPPSGQPGSPSGAPTPVPRTSAQGMSMPNSMPNGNGMPPGRPRPRGPMGPPGPGMRRPPPSMNGGSNGYSRPPTGMGSRNPSRRGSMDGGDLEEFRDLVLYDDIPESGEAGGYPQQQLTPQELAIRERELQLRQRELALREQEMRLRRAAAGMGPGPRRPPPRGNMYDDDDEDDYVDPNDLPPAPMIDPDNFDMMSVTSRKNRRVPSSPAQFRKNPEEEINKSRSRFRPSFGRHRSSGASQQIMNTIPGLHQDIMDDPLLGFTSNRYGNVDRGAIHQAVGSRANSLTAARLDDMQYGLNGNGPRRSSQSPGNPYSPPITGGPVGGRPSPPGQVGPPQPMNGRPSPPDSVRQPMPRYPPGQGNMVAPQQVEQYAGRGQW